MSDLVSEETKEEWDTRVEEMDVDEFIPLK